MFPLVIFLLFLAKSCSANDYFVKTLADSSLQANSVDKSRDLQQNFNDFTTLLAFLSTFDDHISLILNNTIFLREIVNVTFSLSISAKGQKNALFFQEYGMFSVFSDKNIEFKLENLIISADKRYMEAVALLSVDNIANLYIQVFINNIINLYIY